MKQNEKSNELEIRYNEYITQRNLLDRIREESIEEYDKRILTLATGGIILTVTFIDKIGRPFDLVTFILILFVWILFGLVILANIFSFIFAEINSENKIKELDKSYEKQLKTGNYTQSKIKKTKNESLTTFCNRCTLILFLAGTILFCLYIIFIHLNNYNILKEKIMSEQLKKIVNEGKKPLQQPIQKPLTNQDNNTLEKAKTPTSPPIQRPINNQNKVKK